MLQAVINPCLYYEILYKLMCYCLTCVDLLQVSELFKGRLCGLCGNFDYQVSWEYEGPSYEIYRTPKSFTYAYVLPDQTCPIPKDYKSDVEYYPPEKIVDLSQGIKRYLNFFLNLITTYC